MVHKKFIALFLLAVWSISMLHCLADKATAHWHVRETGSAHHHHHDPLTGTHDHSAGEPVGAHSHDSGVSECCGMVVIPVSSTRVEKAFAWQMEIPAAVFCIEYLFRANSSLKDRYHREGWPGAVPRPDLVTRTTALRVPNAPPVIAVT